MDGGAKLGIATGSLAGITNANPDGSRFVYAANTVLSGAAATQAGWGDYVAVRRLELRSEASIPALAAANFSGVAASKPQMRFAGTTVFPAYCVGTVATENRARIVQITEGAAGAAPTTLRLDVTAGAAKEGTVSPVLTVSPGGESIGSIGFTTDTPPSPAVFLTAGVAGALRVETLIGGAFVLDQGNAVPLNAGTYAVRYESPAGMLSTASSKDLVKNTHPVKGIARVRTDATHVLVSYLDPVSKSGVDLVDLHAIDLVTASQQPARGPSLSSRVPLPQVEASWSASRGQRTPRKAPPRRRSRRS